MILRDVFRSEDSGITEARSPANARDHRNRARGVFEAGACRRKLGAGRRGTDGEEGKARVRRVERELYRGGVPVVRGAATVGVAARHSAMISEPGDGPPVLWLIGSAGKTCGAWSQRGLFNSWLALERDDGRGSERRDRRRERLSTSTAGKALWSWPRWFDAEELWPRRVKRTAGTAP